MSYLKIPYVVQTDPPGDVAEGCSWTRLTFPNNTGNVFSYDIKNRVQIKVVMC